MQLACIDPTHLRIIVHVRSLISIFLIAVMTLWASGLAQAVHQQQHIREDAAAARAGKHGRNKLPPTPRHDDCPICVRLHMPIVPHTPVAWLIDTGAWVRYVSMLPVVQQSQNSPSCLLCRGPPAVAAV
jgi:hypothetical protein